MIRKTFQKRNILAVSCFTNSTNISYSVSDDINIKINIFRNTLY